MKDIRPTADALVTKNQIYSAMVVYGLLTYEEEAGEVFIPNRELMERFDHILRKRFLSC